MARERSEEDQIKEGAEHAPATDEGVSAEIEDPSSIESELAEEALREEAEGADALHEEIIKLQEQLAAHKDMALRAQAEEQNARRRAQQDIERARKFAVEKLLQDLLPVVDNLERALATIDTADEANKALVEGIELTHKSFVETLTKNAVEVVDPAGEPFDPELHQAMTQVPNGEVEPNTVLDVFQKGYRLNGRLVRPAMVVVSKAP
ncbi:nucleotide exchange factor GrpE [Microbulbifer sp. EKSA008]|uniref:nucleotide exchange factor GrpE n=1 Tax=unclassified Microbulbifer TaxID=2619833 RepID=UPI0024AE5EC5|nr:nucleotide exchange factor GrpE [Microbulbifer sp. VAAF005]WHI45625.1 nucleotide exchange factor GrpE [Microbulbifer sp. VAAF005]WNZ55646.1 nucleotide exchange factor GrpE [Microbulbifer sp. MKSA007]